MSHAQTGRRMLVESLLTKEHLTDWLYTANAVTAASPKEMLLSPWIIASHPKPQQLEKQQFIVTFDSKLMIKRCLASGTMTAYKKGNVEKFLFIHASFPSFSTGSDCNFWRKTV